MPTDHDLAFDRFIIQAYKDSVPLFFKDSDDATDGTALFLAWLGAISTHIAQQHALSLGSKTRVIPVAKDAVERKIYETIVEFARLYSQTSKLSYVASLERHVGMFLMRISTAFIGKMAQAITKENEDESKATNQALQQESAG